MTFRRWERSRVLPGRIYRTAAGRLAIDTVEEVMTEQISDTDAHRAGYADAAALIGDLRGEEGQPVFRIEFHHLAEPDPRTELANDDSLLPEDIATISARLERLDRASRGGPWTLASLETIQANPERRAPDLAQMLGRETQPFKLDVRKLKNLGLTVSFPVGYRLSRRGEAYLAALRRRGT